MCNAGTANKLFEAVDTALGERQIPRSNVDGFESDTTNLMVGKHNSVLSRIKSKQQVFLARAMSAIFPICVCL